MYALCSAGSPECYDKRDMSNGPSGTVFRVLCKKISTGQEKLALIDCTIVTFLQLWLTIPEKSVLTLQLCHFHFHLQIAQNMTLWSREMPVLYHGHFAHFPMRKLGLSTSPIYINLIRRPLDRLVSHYYFLR